MKARYLILLILIISVLPLVNNSIATHTPADFINITNNAELASHSVSGSGIAGDPYYLNSSEMFINNATGSTTYILNITGTDAFFVIDSFELRSPHYTYDNVTLIHLTDVSNAVIQNSELWFGPHGIQLIRCNNINITNNIIRTYYTGVEIAGTTNSLIQGNIFTGNAGIYFSPIERDYALINAGNKKPSENFTIKDNIFTGGIDTYFQFQYARKAFFTHTFENNSYVDEYDVNIYTNFSPWLIISNVDTVDLKNQLIGDLFIFNVTNVILDNVVYRSDIYIENATSVNINNIRPHDRTVGYQRNKVVVDADYIEISNSHFAKIKKLDSVQIDRKTQYTLSDILPYNYVDIRNATSVNFTKNVVDIRKPDGTKLAGTSLSLENSNNSVIERNDFIANWATHDTIRMYTNSHNATVRYNYFANVSFGGYDFFVKESMNHIFDYNYYDFNPNTTDNNSDGVLDTPLLLNGIMTWWGPGHLVYDQHPLANPYDILNFTISNYEYNNETGTVEVSWTGYDIREVSQFNFSLFVDNGSLWEKIATGDDGTISFNTNNITNGLHLFKLEAATYVWSVNRTFTKNIEFSMIIDNENPTPITTEPSTSETVIPDTVTVTVTATKNNTAISTFTATISTFTTTISNFTTTVFNSNSAGLDTLTLVFLPVVTLTVVYRCRKRK